MLSVDTSTERCGVAIIVAGRVQAALSLNHGETHSRFLLDAIDSLLALSRMALDDIDAYAVTRGPGSFTGLRIGISTVKGLAFATGKPIVGVSSLEVLAGQAGEDADLVCTLMDARRNEVYWCIYRRQGGILRPVTDEQVGAVDDMIDRIDGPCIVIGQAAALYAEKIAKSAKHAVRWAPVICNDIHPSMVAELAWKRFQQGQWDDVETFVPVYLRKSDAEINREKINLLTP
jgi:tRNA threonylcarbamoyladenosine biosynthesis protein TsaB